MTGKSDTREYTINLHKALHKRHLTFKKRAPRAVKVIQEFAKKVTGTKEAKLDVALNRAIWKNGIKALPVRLRIRITKRRSEDEDAKEKYYAFATVAEKQEFQGLGVVVVDDAEN